jgi:hypothetical protein
MKQLLIALFSIAILWQPIVSNAQCAKVKTKTKSADGKEMKMKQKDKMNDAAQINYPYTAEYSSRFEIGNPAYSKMILDLWKDWDNNQPDMHQDYFSDTIVFQAPDGMVIQGKENFLSAGKEQRNKFSNVKSSLEVWIPLRSVDKDEDWVAVWGREEDTDKDGKQSTTMLHEIWGFNKDGKIVFFRQYTATPAKQ